MKILSLSPLNAASISGGVASHATLLKYLTNKGLEVIELDNVLTEGEGAKTSENDLFFSWWVHHVEMIQSNKNYKTIRDIVARIEQEKPDVFITNTLTTPWGAVAAAMTNTPHIWIDREFPSPDPKDEWFLLHDRMDFVKRFSNQVLCNSEKLAEYVKGGYGIETTKFMSYVSSDNLTLSSESIPRRFVLVGEMHPRKNQMDAAKAYKKLLDHAAEQENAIPKLVLFGSKNSYQAEVEKFVRENGMSQFVDFIGFQDEPWSFVTDNDIVLQPSLSESIGRATTEAMKLGLPVIGADIPGTSEAISLGDGILYKSQDVDDFADKMLWALSHPDELAQIGANAQKRSLENMSEEECCSPVLNTILKVAGVGNPVKEIRHMLPYLSTFVKEYEDREQDILNLQAHADNLQAHADNLQAHADNLQAHADNLQAHADNLQAQITDIYGSPIWRVGRVVTLPVQKLKKLLKRASHAS